MIRTPYWEKYKVDIPEGEEGNYSVTKFTVSKEAADFQNARASFSFSCRGLNIYPGTYTQLLRSGTMVMSDTPSEIRDHLGPIHQAEGEVLIVGLGIGMVTSACLAKPGVSRVTVVELSPEVIHLVGDHLKGIHGDRLDIIQSDIFDWKPPKGFVWDTCWFDIHDNICLDNLPEITRFNRKFARRAKWKGAWQEEQLRYLQKQEKRQSLY